MAKYEITAPDGHVYEIDGPEGATDQDVINAVLAQYPSSATPPAKPGADPLAGVAGADSVLNGPVSTRSQGAERRGSHSIGENYDYARERGGGYGIDPKTRDTLGIVGDVIDYGVVPFQAAGYASEAAAHEADEAARYLLGENTTILPGSGAMALAEAFPLGGLELGITPVGPKGRGGVPETDVPSVLPESSVPSLTSMPDAVRQDIASRIDAGQTFAEIKEAQPAWVDADPAAIQSWIDYRATGGKDPVTFAAERTDLAPDSPEARLQQEAEAFQGAPEPTPESVFPSEVDLAAREAALTERLTAEADAWLNKKELPDATPDTALARAEGVTAEINRLAEDWTNAPDVEVVHAINDIADEGVRAQAIADGAKGFVGPDGKIRVIAQNLTDPADVPAVLYHEALGHNGLSNLFQDRLDSVLTSFYDGSTDFRGRVDQWLSDNPSAYIDAPDRVARAADEVLAEMSEAGPISPTLYNRLKNQIKAFARRVGLKDVFFSDREINTILGMAHDSVINGRRGDVAANGFRYTRQSLADWFKNSQVVDSEGAPATVYHGTSVDKDFSSFKMKDRGIWFTEDPEGASLYAVDNDSQRIVRDPDNGPWGMKKINTSSRVFPVHLRISNPKIYQGRELVDAVRQRGGESYARGEAALFRELRREGFDGVKVEGEPGKAVWVTLDAPNQIKSATGNRGTFDPSKSDIRFMKGNRPKKSLSPSSMRTKNDVDDLLTFLGNESREITSEPRTIREIERDAEDLGLTASKYLKGKNLQEEGLSAKILGAKQLLTTTVDELAQLGTRAETEGMTPSVYASIREKLAVVQAVYSRFDEDTSEIGRSMRVLKEVTESRRSMKESLRFMNEAGGLELLRDPEALMRFMANIKTAHAVQGPAAAARAIQKAGKKHWEDYAGSVVFNFMLSQPSTWALNFLGSPINFLTDLMTDSVAAVGGQLRRGSDRVYGREILARVQGSIAAASQYSTWKNTFEAFKTAESQGAGSAGKTGSRGLVLPGPLTVVETPTRIMAATDEYWSSFFNMSNLYSEAARQAAGEGLKGSAYKTRFNDLVANPTPEMLEKAKKTTDRQLFRDEPGPVGRKLMELMSTRFEDEVDIKMRDDGTGKMVPYSRTVKEKHGQGMRATKFAGKLLVPFVPTLDSIARTIIRNAGPLALFSKDIRKDLMSGGAARQSALARISVSSAAMAYWAMKAADGELTGAQDGDYREAAAEASVRPPFSIKVGDRWVSYRGLDPVAGQIAAVATAVDRSRNGEDIGDVVTGLITGTAAALKESSYAQSFANSLELGKEAVDIVEKGDSPMTAATNFAVGQAANLANPGFFRWINQEFLDPQARDTTGDGGIVGRVEGRVSAGTPGLSDNLPQKYDVFGRPTLNAKQNRDVETDETVLEINRLERSGDAILMGPPDKTIYKNTEYETKLTGEQYQAYQQYSGYWATEDIRAEMATPEWSTYSDEEKIKVIKDIVTQAREDARDELFPKEEE